MIDGELSLMDKDQLAKILPGIAQEHKFRMEILEKDYYLTIILNDLHDHLSDKLVFKGGTLLNKIHLNYHRLSEDLDFTYMSDEGLTSRSQRSRAISPIRENMPGFLAHLELKSLDPKGQGYNNSTQYVFEVLYPSFISGKDERIKIEVSLRQRPIDKPIYNEIQHFYKDPFTGRDLVPRNKILSLSLNEAVAEKLRAAITRNDKAIRDYYDLWWIEKIKFNFHDKHFLDLFKKKLKEEGYKGGYKANFGLSEKEMEGLQRQTATDLIPVIRIGEAFDLNKVFNIFNKIFIK